MKGSCLCGAVRYEVTGTPTAFDLDHCSRCRKSSGSAFRAELIFEATEFECSADDRLPRPMKRQCGRPGQDIDGHSARYAVDRCRRWTVT